MERHCRDYTENIVTFVTYFYLYEVGCVSLTWCVVAIALARQLSQLRNINTACRNERCLGYLHTTVHLPTSSHSSFVVIEPRAKYSHHFAILYSNKDALT
jgi:hypothetical protein